MLPHGYSSIWLLLPRREGRFVGRERKAFIHHKKLPALSKILLIIQALMCEECFSTNIFPPMITKILHKKIRVTDKKLNRWERKKKETKTKRSTYFSTTSSLWDAGVIAGHLCAVTSKTYFYTLPILPLKTCWARRRQSAFAWA